jgi:hypothetical protein
MADRSEHDQRGNGSVESHTASSPIRVIRAITTPAIRLTS